jgi:hypothetical protein
MKKLYALMLAGARGEDVGALLPTVRTIYPARPRGVVNAHADFGINLRTSRD